MNIINGLHFNNLRGDIYGGLTAAVVALPLALAMGVASGVGPIAGMYGAIMVGFFAALFGGTPSQVSGPTGPMTVVLAAVFTQYTTMFPDNPSHGAAIAFTVVMLGGIFQIAFGYLKLGKFIELVPHPVVSGFMSGIGVIIILLQLAPLMGHATPPGPMQASLGLPEVLSNISWNSLGLGILALLIVYFLPKKISQIIPAPLVALIVCTLVYLFAMPEGSAPVLGDIPTGLPHAIIPDFEITLIPDMIESALTLAILGSIDSLLTSLVADNVTRTYHNSDRELIGQGIGNTIAGIFGGLPGAGATMRTVVNINAGGKTPISGGIHALVLLAIVLGAGSLASHIPNAVLAGILIKVGTDIIDWDYLKHLKRAPATGNTMMTLVLVVTVFVGLITAVAIGMAMAGMIFMKRMVDLQLESIKTIRDVDEDTPLAPEEKEILKRAEGKILVFHLGGPMSFGAAKGMIRRLSGFDLYEVLIIELTDVPQVDFTSTRALYDIVHDAQEKGRDVFIVGCCESVRKVLARQEVIEKVSEKRLIVKRLDALQQALELIEKRSAEQQPEGT